MHRYGISNEEKSDCSKQRAWVIGGRTHRGAPETQRGAESLELLRDLDGQLPEEQTDRQTDSTQSKKSEEEEEQQAGGREEKEKRANLAGESTRAKKGEGRRSASSAWRMGRAKAAVLPDPVWASPITSRPGGTAGEGANNQTSSRKEERTESKQARERESILTNLGGRRGWPRPGSWREPSTPDSRRLPPVPGTARGRQTSRRCPPPSGRPSSLSYRRPPRAVLRLPELDSKILKNEAGIARSKDLIYRTFL